MTTVTCVDGSNPVFRGIVNFAIFLNQTEAVAVAAILTSIRSNASAYNNEHFYRMDPDTFALVQTIPANG